jgi:hypothetical protein
LQAFKIELRIASLNKVKVQTPGELLMSIKDGKRLWGLIGF